MRFILNLLTGTTGTQRRVSMIPRCCHLEGVRPQPKTFNILQDMLRQIRCTCLCKQRGHARTLRSNGTAKRGWYVANLLFVSCELNPSTSLHPVHNLCVRLSVNSWLEMEVPCRTACTNETQHRNPWKASKAFKKKQSSRRSQVNVCSDPLSAPCLMSHCLTWACYYATWQ